MLRLASRPTVSHNLHLAENLANCEKAQHLSHNNRYTPHLLRVHVSYAVHVSGEGVDEALGVVAGVVGVAEGGDYGVVGLLHVCDCAGESVDVSLGAM
jgi:hypothetical protein